MSKDDMINWLLRNSESDRYRLVDGLAATRDHRDERSRLDALSYGEIEDLYLNSEELYALSA